MPVKRSTIWSSASICRPFEKGIRWWCNRWWSIPSWNFGTFWSRTSCRSSTILWGLLWRWVRFSSGQTYSQKQNIQKKRTKHRPTKLLFPDLQDSLAWQVLQLQTQMLTDQLTLFRKIPECAEDAKERFRQHGASGVSMFSYGACHVGGISRDKQATNTCNLDKN